MGFASNFLAVIQNLSIHLGNTMKVVLVGAAGLFFLVSMIILGWQIYRYCKHRKAKKTKAKNAVGETDSKKQYTEKSNLTTRNNSSDFLGMSDEDEYSVVKKHEYKVHKLQESIQKLSLYLQCSDPRDFKLIQSNDNLVIDSKIELSGNLKFSLSYDKKQSELQLTVIEASNLPARHVSQCADFFTRIKLFTSLPQYQCILHQSDTKIVKNTRNPLFGDQFTYFIEDDTYRKATLKLEVWDFDKYSRRDVLGEVRLPFSNLEFSNTVAFCEKLQKVQKEVVGEIFVSLKYLPTARKLEVTILRVKTGCLSNSPDTGIYTRVDFYVNQHKVKYQKTPAKLKSEITMFNEVILFTVSDSVINQSMIITSVYEISLSKDSARHLLGRAYVGSKKSKEDDHWLSMLQSLRQPVSKWHPLLI
ncbi:synaptotagmin-2 [Carcharodon carcharias]|uniref:synaptotagmin-2 n=1 Tax=Carcharodon carcharias TaxID=13397 RepID=UPI001B7F3344|nr:synaptotagmin-2 [Carcharodon carcharias]XP_041053767.1 synaptotagmin-2 [Carcharodon carcharias]XP_041053768.1 synaptotagmin-2 [Carcharodon carcharias]